MTKQIRNLAWCGLAATVALLAADGFVGKWKLDPAKSDFGETSITFAAAPTGGTQMTVDGQNYTYKTDGKDYDGMFGSKMSWKAVDANTWEATNKMGGKILSTDTYKLSADGKSLTLVSKGTAPAGGAFENTTVYQRASGTSGINGKWKTKNIKMSSAQIIELASSGGDSLSFRMPEQKLTCDAKLDGKSYPCTGPEIPPNTSVIFKKAGADSFSADITIGGRLSYQSKYTVSADGKTLTESGSAVGTTEKYKAVYDRQ